jgi:hypothetical protein
MEQDPSLTREVDDGHFHDDSEMSREERDEQRQSQELTSQPRQDFGGLPPMEPSMEPPIASPSGEMPQDLPLHDPENGEPPTNFLEHLEQDTLLPETIGEYFGLESKIEDIETMVRFIELLKDAKLDGSKMDTEDIARLRCASSEFPSNAFDPNFLFALRSFFACNNASQETYNRFCAAALARHPEDEFLSYHQVRRRIEQISGVVPITHDMCINSCCAFIGPFEDFTECHICAEPRYESGLSLRGRNERPRRQFHTIPIGPVLQALYRSPENAKKMHYRKERTAEILSRAQTNHGKIKIDIYDDVYVGSDYLKAVLEGRIKDDDILIQIAIDGAQLFRNKPSDCWMYIYIIHNLSPDHRYKKQFVIPGGFIPGPQKPKHLVSFLLPGLYHLSVLQNEGLSIWDSSRTCSIHNDPSSSLITPYSLRQKAV